MKINKLYIFAALLGTVLAGCQRVEEDTQKPDEKPVVEQGWTLTVQARINAETRAMSVEQVGEGDDAHDQVITYWKCGEKVAVFANERVLGTLEVMEVDNSGLATLKGEIEVKDQVSGDPYVEVGTELSLLFPDKTDFAWYYMGQDGSIPDEDGRMASFYDYATATLKVTSMDAGTVNAVGYNPDTQQTVDSPTFALEQSVYRFSFKDTENNNNLVSVKSLTLSSYQNKLVRTRILSDTGWTTDENGYGSLTMKPGVNQEKVYWMAIRNENKLNDIYYFTIVDENNKLFLVDKNIPAGALDKPRFISAKGIKVEQTAFAPNTTATTPPTIDSANGVL